MYILYIELACQVAWFRASLSIHVRVCFICPWVWNWGYEILKSHHQRSPGVQCVCVCVHALFYSHSTVATTNNMCCVLAGTCTVWLWIKLTSFWLEWTFSWFLGHRSVVKSHLFYLLVHTWPLQPREPSYSLYPTVVLCTRVFLWACGASIPYCRYVHVLL